MKKVKINRSDFELYFELGSDEMTPYLDTEDGSVLLVENSAAYQVEKLLTNEETLEAVEAAIRAQENIADWEREQLLTAARIEWDDIQRYRPIPKQDSQEGYRDMQKYIGSLDDEHLREVLEVAIQESGAFRRFKDVLSQYPEAQAQWFKFQEAQRHKRILAWFASEGLEPEIV